MAPDSTNPFLIPPPPPGLLPPKPADAPPSEPAPTLAPPPVITGTSRVSPSAERAEPSEIIFFPSLPGATPAATAAWQLALPNGTVFPVTRAVFLGRDPARTQDRPGAELAPIEDPARSLSKTHALLELDGGKLWVHDLDSTNGVVVASPGVEPIIVEPGERAEVPADSELRLGSYVIRVHSRA